MQSRLAVFLAIAGLGVAAPARALTITEQTPSTPYPGITLIAGRTTSPTTRFWVTKVSLCTNYIHVTARRAPSTLATAAEWGNARGVQVAVNGDFYLTSPIRVYGDAVGDGVRWPSSQTGLSAAYAGDWYYRRYGWIAFGDDWVDFSHTEHVKLNAAKFGANEGFSPTKLTTAIPNGTLALVSGFPELVVEGTQYTCSSPTATSCFPDRGDMRARHPRTAMGLSQDRRTFYLVAVDGRSTVSAGMYGTELAELMKKLGAYQAFNLDGGGSTQMWLKSRGTVNTPSDGTPRSVANHWGIFAGATSGKPADPGSCVPTVVPSDAGVDARIDAAPDARPVDAFVDDTNDQQDAELYEDAEFADVSDERPSGDPDAEPLPDADVDVDAGVDASAAEPAPTEDDAGCSCRTTNAGGFTRAGSLLLVALAAVARRRRAAA